MDVIAKARFIRVAPRKVRLVVDTVRGLSVATAEFKLQHINKAAALPILKLLRSAMANAEHNFKLDKTTLYISKITADQGPALKRYRPRAFGRASLIKKQMTHITIILSEKQPEKPAKKEKKSVKEKTVKQVSKK